MITSFIMHRFEPQGSALFRVIKIGCPAIFEQLCVSRVRVHFLSCANDETDIGGALAPAFLAVRVFVPKRQALEFSSQNFLSTNAI